MRFAVAACCLIQAVQAGYEVWASDQSNSAPDQSKLGVKGSFLWIFDSDDIETQLSTGTPAPPVPCYDGQPADQGCDILEVFPQDLEQQTLVNGALETTGSTLNDLSGFGRLHGVLGDPQNKYVVANMFAPGGGYVGIIDTATKEAIGLFRVTQFGSGRSVHMSFFSADGSAILIDNLNGKAIEKIVVERDASGTITDLIFDQSQSLGLGKGTTVVESVTVFQGLNAKGNPLMGTIAGAYDFGTQLNDLTPNGKCKENGCNGTDGSMGGRPNNLPICPITSENGFLYVTLAAGGMFVVEIAGMKIVAEYGNNIVYGAGCGGVEARGNKMFMNSGVSASGAGADQSMFAVWEFDDNAFLTSGLPENTPLPEVVFEDPNNTKTGGNLVGDPSNPTGQLASVTTRRDSHGMDITSNNKYLHVVDRIQNVMEVFDTTTHRRFSYDLTSRSGKGRRRSHWYLYRLLFGGLDKGVCEAASVEGVSSNDPAPDLFERTPDGKYFMIAFRGPAPVSVPHSAQGSCPGVGIVKLCANGKFGRLVGVLRTTNTVPDLIDDITLPNGFDTAGNPLFITYSGNERSDVHGAIVVSK